MPTILTSSSLVDVANAAAWAVAFVTVVTAGIPVQGPVVSNPINSEILIYAPRSNGNKRLFVATSSANALVANSRIELRAGESLSLKIDNANLLWFDASAAATIAQIITEG